MAGFLCLGGMFGWISWDDVRIFGDGISVMELRIGDVEDVSGFFPQHVAGNDGN